MSMVPGISLDKGSGSFAQTQLVLSGQVILQIAFMTSPTQKYSLNAALGGQMQDTFEMLMTALNELSEYLKQKSVETLKSIFYCLTMQLDTFESFSRETSQGSDLANDWNPFRVLFTRVSKYEKIKNHGDHKVTSGALPEDDLAFMQSVMNNLEGKCFCVTSPNKQVGLVPERVQLGDSLAIIEGAPLPFLLRQTSIGTAGNRKPYNLLAMRMFLV